MAVTFSFAILVCFFIGLLFLIYGFKRKSKWLLGGSLVAFLIVFILTYIVFSGIASL